ncbi:MAG: GGDEF domain-containing protein [Deltaproteobacteria bacterium]|nr:MAG: GGDEF domain-containing protein [Deltaproteobacteria bacterium]
MKSTAVRPLLSFLVPGGLLFLGISVVLQTDLLGESQQAVAPIYLYGVAIAGILLGSRFNRSRLVFAILVLFLADRALVHFASGKAVYAEMPRLVSSAIALLLPLNLAALSQVRERGILTLRGVCRLGLILVQVLAVFLISRYWYLSIVGYLDYTFVGTAFLKRIPLSQPALFTFGATLLLLGLRFKKRKGVFESGFFWALLSVLFALAVSKEGSQSTIYFATAGLILITSLIETSYSMAFQDELTGLPGRRALEEAFLKLGGSYTVAMLDIDHFKKFNDKHGHDVGDQVLRMVASKLAKVNGGGKPFRYGGEEFAVIFPGKLAYETIPYLEKLREAVENADFVLRSGDRRRRVSDNPKKKKSSRGRLSITISIGVAERNERLHSPQQVIKAADKALYRAKKAGRNKVKTTLTTKRHAA